MLSNIECKSKHLCIYSGEDRGDSSLAVGDEEMLANNCGSILQVEICYSSSSNILGGGTGAVILCSNSVPWKF